MISIRYLNLFERVTGVRTKNCFSYNNAVVFAVPRMSISRAIGSRGDNVKKISEIIKRKIKIIGIPRGLSEAPKFIADIISPVGFKSVEITDNEIIINAGSQNKAALIGRNKIRMQEMHEIIKEYFNRELKIV